MEPLDLRTNLPRRARAELDGITFLPRSIDKVRAFTEAVRGATSDADVAAYVRAHAKPGGIEAWNGFVTRREIYNGDRAEAIADNPWLADHPELVYSIDFLDYVDEHGI